MTRNSAPEITYAPTSAITHFHYDFVHRVAGIDALFLSDESSLTDFNGPDHQPGDHEYWMEKIKQEYGIDLRDVPDKSLNIGVLGRELERRLGTVSRN